MDTRAKALICNPFERVHLFHGHLHLRCAVSLIRSGNTVHLEGIQFGSNQNVDLVQKC